MYYSCSDFHPRQLCKTAHDVSTSCFSGRRVQSNTTDEDESPNNYNTLRVLLSLVDLS